MSILHRAQGLHTDVLAAEYHERILGVVNKGALDAIARTPAHYRAWLVEEAQGETPALRFGRALHCAALEPDVFAQQWALRPDFGDLRTKAGKESRDEWIAEHVGVETLDADEWQRIEAMQSALRAHPIAGRVLQRGASEVTAIWQNGDTGLLCKARFDYWRQDLGLIIDLKTTEDASPAAFARSVANYRYAVQQAHYCAGASVDKFLFVAVEKSPPHAVAVYQLDRDSARRGEELRARDMDTLSRCIERDDWPSYPADVTTLSLPAWAFKDAA